jgi:hypothetical protein
MDRVAVESFVDKKTYFLAILLGGHFLVAVTLHAVFVSHSRSGLCPKEHPAGQNKQTQAQKAKWFIACSFH